MMKSIVVATLIAWAFLFASAEAQTFPATSIVDDFNRAPEDPIDGGIWSNGVTGVGSCAVEADTPDNTLGTSGAGTDECYLTQTYSADQEIWMTLEGATNYSDQTNLRLLGCLQDNIGTASVDGYAVRFKKINAGNDQIFIQTLDNGVYSNIGTFTEQEMDDNDQLGMRIKSNGDIEAWVNTGGGWTMVKIENDTTYNCANTNLGVAPTQSSHQFDDLGAGNTITVTPTNTGRGFIILESN